MCFSCGGPETQLIVTSASRAHRSPLAKGYSSILITKNIIHCVGSSLNEQTLTEEIKLTNNDRQEAHGP